MADKIDSMVNEARFLKNELGEVKKAIKLCDKILKIDTNNRDAMLIKAGALRELGKFEEFIGAIQSIINKWPNHWEAYYLLSMFYFILKEDDKALQLMEHSVKLDENFNNVISYAQIVYLTGKGEYMEYVEKAKRIDKGRAENFLKNIWIWDIEGIKPTFRETLKAFKSAGSLKKAEEKLKGLK